MAGIVNNTARQIDLRATSKAGKFVSVNLNIGFNIVPDEDYKILMANPLCKMLESGGAITSNMRESEADRKLREQVENDANREVNQLAVPERAASLIEGDARLGTTVATAEGSMGAGIDSTDGEDDLLA